MSAKSIFSIDDCAMEAINAFQLLIIMQNNEYNTQTWK